MSSCRFKYIDDKFQSTNPKLADELTDAAINIWGKLKASNLFSIKDSKMFFNKEKTKKRIKQDELVSSINNEYKQEVVKNIDNNVNVNVLPLAGDSNSTSPVYSAVFFNTEDIISKYAPVHSNVFSHHSTIEFKPSNVSNLPIGETKTIKIVGRLTTDKVDTLIVENSLSKNKFPHITLSTAEGVKPFESNAEIENNQDKIKPIDDTIEGVVGYFNDGKEYTTKNSNIKPGVEELFNENETLANAVYEALGLSKKLDFYKEDTLAIDEKTYSIVEKISSKELAKRNGLTISSNIPVYIVSESLGSRKGGYDIVNNIIILSKDSDKETIHHELIHSVEYNLDKSELNHLYEKVKDTITEDSFNGFVSWNFKKNISEFVADALSKKVFRDALKKEGLLEEVDNVLSVYTSDTTPQQKQQAQQLYSQYLNSLNKLNTNPILQNNQQEQVKKFAELQERLNNKEFLEGAKNAYESTPALQELGTQQEYNDYIARVSLGIIKNPSSGEYNYVSKIKDIVYRGSEKGIENDNRPYLYFTINKNEATIYAKTHFTKGGNINERNPIPSIRKNIEKYIDDKYGKNSFKSLITDKQNFYEQISEENYELRLPEWYKEVELSNEDKSLLKDFKDLKQMYDIVKIESEEDLMKQYDDTDYQNTKPKYDKLRNKLSPFFNQEQIGKIEPVILNIQNPYTEEIVQEDLQNNRDAYKNGHDGAFLMDGDHFVVKKSSEQIHILGSKQDVENFAKFVGNNELGNAKDMENYMSSKSVDYIMDKLIQSGKIEKRC